MKDPEIVKIFKEIKEICDLQNKAIEELQEKVKALEDKVHGLKMHHTRFK